KDTQILERFTTHPDALLSIERTKPRETVKQIKNPTGLIAQLRRLPGIVAAAPEVTGEAIASYGTKNVNMAIVGIEPEQQQRVTTIGKDIKEGDFKRLRTSADFLKIFKVQTVITYVITGALLIVAAFGVLNILIMAVLERVNDIAILKSFGLSRGDVTLIYLFQGMVIGLIGALLGVVMGK